MQGRAFVVTDWPPATLPTSYPLHEVVRPSACQALFDEDQRGRPPIAKSTIRWSPLTTASRFKHAFTQPHCEEYSCE